jgi:L-ascorbate metabolism protein UlaG (beta-lactamase superfamily)
MRDLRITYAGHSAVFVELGGMYTAIDPWLKGNPLCPHALQEPGKLDLIVLTHGHSDHAGDAVRVQKLTGAKLAATYELAMIMIDEGIPADKVIPMNKGGSVTLGSLTVRLTDAFHSSSYDSSKGAVYAGEACGALLSTPDRCVYHAGDTSLFSDMKLLGELYAPTVALLPIGDRFTMGPHEAAHAARLIRPQVAIPIHYKTFDLLTGSYADFAKECDAHKVKHTELQVGESVTV